MDPQAAAKYFEEKLALTMGISQLKKKMDSKDEDFVIIDSRSEEAYTKGHIPGAIWVDCDLDKIDTQWERFSKTKVNVIYCYGILCLRGPRVCMQAAKKGFQVMELHGNYDGWVEYGFDVDKGKPE